MSTQTESLQAIKPHRPSLKLLVMDAMFMQKPMTRAELTRETGMRHSSLTARVNELLAEGKIVVDGQKYDIETRRNVETLSLV